MKGNEIWNQCKRALEELESQLVRGNDAPLTRFLEAIAVFPDYSFRNVMLILSQKPDATSVAGIRAWNKLKRWVKKGEKAIAIIAPMIAKGNKKEAESEDKTESPRFRAVYVFDVSQTDGEPLPDTAEVKGDPAGYLEALKTLVIEKGISLEYVDSLDNALGRSKGGAIQIVRGLDPASEFSVLAHELAHELLHRNGARPEKRQRETEAEAVAFAVCRFAGLDCGVAHAEYIQLFQGDSENFRRSLDTIQQAAHGIIQGLSDKRDPLLQAA